MKIHSEKESGNADIYMSTREVIVMGFVPIIMGFYGFFNHKETNTLFIEKIIGLSFVIFGIFIILHFRKRFIVRACKEGIQWRKSGKIFILEWDVIDLVELKSENVRSKKATKESIFFLNSSGGILYALYFNSHCSKNNEEFIQYVSRNSIVVDKRYSQSHD